MMVGEILHFNMQQQIQWFCFTNHFPGAEALLTISTDTFGLVIYQMHFGRDRDLIRKTCRQMH